MSNSLVSMAVSAAGMQSQAARLRLASENIANADTPGYRRKLIEFEKVAADQNDIFLTVPGRVSLDQSELQQIYDPSHPMAGEDGYFLGSNVNLVVEIADAREAQRSYEANLKMLEQAQQMTAATLELLRR